jgi:hypothetical protein
MIEGTQTEVNAKKELTVQIKPVVTSKIRSVMKAMEGTCIAVSEIMVWGKGDAAKAVPGLGDDASLESILINGKPIKEFQSGQFAYTVRASGKPFETPVIEATTTDIYASYQVEQVPGETAAVIKVTSENGLKTELYTVEFTTNKQ